MSWSNFVANIKAIDIRCEETPEASRYGGIADMYLTPVIAESSPLQKNITANLCFATVGNADLAISALFITETNILHIDWDHKVLSVAQLRMEEMLQVISKEDFQPSKLHDNKKICENDFKQPYDFEYWERMNMALIVHYRKNGDPRAEELADELKLEHGKYGQREKHLEILDHGHKYKINEFDRESMQEFSIENQRVLLN